MEGSFLSDIVDLEDFSDCDVLNLIVAPCGAGKTKFALEKIATLWGKPEQTLYLIDSVAGRDQLLQNPKCQCYTKEWRESDVPAALSKEGKVTVMTYAFFGTLCKHFPRWDEQLTTIICDEIHKLFEMMLWDNSKKIPYSDSVYHIAWNAIFNDFYLARAYVVAMTATPELLYNHIAEERDPDDGTMCYYPHRLEQFIHKVPLHGTPRHYEQKNVHDYNNLIMLCNQLPPKKRGIIYMTRISTMERCANALRFRGIRAVCIWSPNNINWWMSKEQYEVRNYIIENAAMPDDVDVLLINKSCETSINIHSHIDYMVVHSSQKDTRIQALGRYRNDLEDLYLYNPDIWDDLDLPDEMLGTPLFKEDILEYIAKQNIRDETGRLMKQPSFLQYVKRCGYDISEKKKKGGKRYHIIQENPSPQN